MTLITNLQLSVVGHNFASFIGFMNCLLVVGSMDTIANPQPSHDRLPTTNPYIAV